MQHTLILLKPSTIQRQLVGEIISRFEKRGFQITALKMVHMSRETAERHYQEHKDKDFYPGLLEAITSGPVVAMVLEADSAVEVARSMCGATDPKRAAPGTIRGDYGMHTMLNRIHASDSPQSSEREIAIFFKPEEIQSYELVARAWI